ncbi:TPM domain-containing protein [Fodinibius sediminis]|uniref:TLP18.3, Psb32 and MOLO-1 founding protein of phosphatase n=1 Tax=Fodinibius sediminis TaxID=1214077 RepID=A0A521EA62_9BACT|nr:TPM domain-containing protein [Fodinibius sediminis]SMO80817.1 TLP18.3, Psb32 and MOLO-1 founding protein of phosphatase [Fodinibius sediminis]
MAEKPFLTDEQEQLVIKAIKEAERQTSGEIRVHIESQCKGEALQQAARIFHDLGMDQTREQNGVLIYVASEDHKAAIYAGRGVHSQVEDHFWSTILDDLITHFKQQEFEKGLEEAVRQVGEELASLFPGDAEDDDELSNEISYN